MTTGPAAELRTRSTQSTGHKLRRVLWAGVEATLFRLSFHNWYRWRAFLLRLFGAQLGKNCRLRRTAHVYYPWKLVMGDLCIVGDHATLYNLGPITLGHRVMISQEAYLCAGTHDHTKKSLPLLTPPITVSDDAWICARAFIGPGLTVGAGSVVAAAAVAVKNVPPWTIVGGNPAKFIKQRVLEEQ